MVVFENRVYPKVVSMGLDLEEQKVRADSAAKRPSFSFGKTPRFTTTNQKPISFKNRVEIQLQSHKHASSPREA